MILLQGKEQQRCGYHIYHSYCRCGLSKSDGFVLVGSLLALFGLVDYRARPEFCVREPWGSLSFAFSFPTLVGVGLIIHELNIQGIRLCVSRPSHSTVCRRNRRGCTNILEHGT